MNKIKTAAIIAAAFVSAGAGAAEVYKTDSASLPVYGRVKAEALNGYGYQNIRKDRQGRPSRILAYIASRRKRRVKGK